ncbi:MAG TPA: DUF4932 domain-containing protein [Longimicrobiales bacterium]|nr:DUF4932 domain-containing protein [Longimicrobiales bacterium]
MRGPRRLAAVLLLAAPAALAAQEPPPPPPDSTPPAALRGQPLDADAPLTRGSLRVLVDPRIELMSVVQLLADYPLVTRHGFAYRQEVARRFEPWRAHHAVTLFRELGGQGFSFDAVPKLMVALSEPPLLVVQDALPRDVVARAGGEESVQGFVQALREFAFESDFTGFFLENDSLYGALVADAAPHAAAALAALRDYLGSELGETLLVLGPLLHDGGFAALQERRAGLARAYAFLGPEGVQGGQPDFGSPARIGATLWHELAHTVVNPLTAAHEERVAATAPLLEPVAEAMARQAYRRWETVVNETVIRALTSRILAVEVGEAAGERALADDEEKGFLYARPLAERLREFEAERERFATFAAFYPRLLDALEEIAAAGG